MNFEEAMIYINSFSQSGRKVTDLSRIKKLLNLIGNPQDNLKFVHIAGTNGKGSVLEFCSNALINAGYKTGQFTSPYIKEYCDRIRINGQNIPKEKVAYYCMYVKKYADNLFFSQFEITFAIALLYYKEEACDIVFLEAGIGGELDATNIISSPLVSVITSVSLDHTQILGDTIEEIAVQKVGIIKENSYAVLSYDNEESVKKIALSKAFEKGSTLIVPDSSQIYIDKLNLKETEFRYKNKSYKLKMCGKHQIVNAVTAIEILSILNNIKLWEVRLMALKQGSISIDTENIFPIIKKWLYSDKDIFVRELISNGCDAVHKLKRLVSLGEAKIEEDNDYKIVVKVNKDKKTLSFSDNGIGMTAEEVEKYITQVAFSGAGFC